MELRWTQDPAWQGLGTILEVRENSPKKRSKSGAAGKSDESRERGGGLPLRTSNPGHWQLAGRLAAGRLADWQTGRLADLTAIRDTPPVPKGTVADYFFVILDTGFKYLSTTFL